MDDRHRSRLSWSKVLGWCFSLAALFFVGRWMITLDHNVWNQLRHLDVSYLVGSIIMFQAWFGLRYLGWERMSRLFGNATARHGNMRLWVLSELTRYVPGNIWSFAARYQGSRTGGSSRSEAVAAVTLEALGLISGAAMVAAICSQAFFGGMVWWLMLVLLAFTGLAPLGLRWLARRRPALSPLSRISVSQAYALLAWYTLIWIVFGAANALIMIQFPGSAHNIGTAIFYGAASVIAWLIGYLSFITPMGLGVREVTLAKLVQSPGSLSPGLGGVMAIMTRLWLIVSEFIFLGLVLGWSSIKRRT